MQLASWTWMARGLCFTDCALLAVGFWSMPSNLVKVGLELTRRFSCLELTQRFSCLELTQRFSYLELPCDVLYSCIVIGL